MELALLLLSSVIIARFVAKRSIVISVAHSVLFVFLMAVWPFTTESHLVTSFMAELMPGNSYAILHEAFAGTGEYIGLGFSAVLVVEIVSVMSTSIALIISSIKTLKAIRRLLKKGIVRKTVFVGTSNFTTDVPAYDFHQVKSGTYLQLCQLRN